MKLRPAAMFAALFMVTVTSALPLFGADKPPQKTGEWEKLGERTVSKKEERDVIDVTSTNHFTAISFKVEKGDIAVEDVKITFDNDETFSPDTKLTFKEGEKSGKIDLPGKSRGIKRIRFLYKTIGKGEAVVSVHGKIGDAPKK